MPQPFIARCWIYKTWWKRRDIRIDDHRPFPVCTSHTVNQDLGRGDPREPSLLQGATKETARRKSLSRHRAPPWKKERKEGRCGKVVTIRSTGKWKPSGSSEKKCAAGTECRWMVDSSDRIEGLHLCDAARCISNGRERERKPNWLRERWGYESPRLMSLWDWEREKINKTNTKIDNVSLFGKHARWILLLCNINKW